MPELALAASVVGCGTVEGPGRAVVLSMMGGCGVVHGMSRRCGYLNLVNDLISVMDTREGRVVNYCNYMGGLPGWCLALENVAQLAVGSLAECGPLKTGSV